MIREITKADIPECVSVIRESFLTVGKQFNITPENAPMFTAYATDEAKILHWMDNQHRPMYGCFEDGKLVGYYNLYLPAEKCSDCINDLLNSDHLNLDLIFNLRRDLLYESCPCRNTFLAALHLAEGSDLVVQDKNICNRSNLDKINSVILIETADQIVILSCCHQFIGIGNTLVTALISILTF